MCGKTYTRDELREVTKAEAATLDDTNWRGGVFDFDTFRCWLLALFGRRPGTRPVEPDRLLQLH
jgi:hypothetical protein